ncbi:unnamed protein product [Paramecium primaurelia]|uniref:Uncharacterized protein n=1 Tax=Paramecium primaurelia TaxID=5886 RepID=A0A8S1KWV2_PARPR|nr:unnamed protein product [Paramecium primaurelia]
MGITSALQRKKLLQWIQIGLEEFTNYCKSHTRNEVTPLMVQTFMEVQQISSPRAEIPYKERLPLKVIQDRIYNQDMNMMLKLKKKLHQDRFLLNLFHRLEEGKNNNLSYLLQSLNKKQQKKTQQDKEHKLYYQNIFAEQMQQIQKPIILSPQKQVQQQSLQESDYHLPQFGTPKFDKQEKKDTKKQKKIINKQYYLIQSPKTQNINQLLKQKRRITNLKKANKEECHHRKKSRKQYLIIINQQYFYLQIMNPLVGLMYGSLLKKNSFIYKIEEAQQEHFFSQKLKLNQCKAIQYQWGRLKQQDKILKE